MVVTGPVSAGAPHASPCTTAGPAEPHGQVAGGIAVVTVRCCQGQRQLLHPAIIMSNAVSATETRKVFMSGLLLPLGKSRQHILRLTLHENISEANRRPRFLAFGIRKQLRATVQTGICQCLANPQSFARTHAGRCLEGGVCGVPGGSGWGARQGGAQRLWRWCSWLKETGAATLPDRSLNRRMLPGERARCRRNHSCPNTEDRSSPKSTA